MNTIIKLMIMSGLVVTGLSYGATAQEKQDEIVSLLQEYWMDKDGNVRIGDKDAATLRFSFNKAVLDKMTDAQLRTSMDAALVRFTKEQQDEFKKIVMPLLDELKKSREALVAESSKMQNAAEKLAKILNKTAQDVMRLPDENLKTLIIDRITDRTARLDALDQLSILSKLRKEAATKTTMAEGRTRSKDGLAEEETTSTKVKTSTAQNVAKGIASANFKISGMVGFVGESWKYSMCADRHFDIVMDSEGIQFMSIAK